jgi:hypothetical protein
MFINVSIIVFKLLLRYLNNIKYKAINNETIIALLFHTCAPAGSAQSEDTITMRNQGGGPVAYKVFANNKRFVHFSFVFLVYMCIYK